MKHLGDNGNWCKVDEINVVIEGTKSNTLEIFDGKSFDWSLWISHNGRRSWSGKGDKTIGRQHISCDEKGCVMRRTWNFFE